MEESGQSICARYQAMVAAGRIEADAAQAALARRLDILHHDLSQFHAPLWQRIARRIIWQVRRLFLRTDSYADTMPRGVYIYGGVGRGKSMLMDMFFDAAPIDAKWRVHFHLFMQEVHALIAQARQNRAIANPLPYVARQIAARTKLLCFDEFQVHDIADASILGQLFECLWRAGVVVVSTSNRHPDALYEGGLNRQRFLPFIEMLKTKLDVVELASAQDYRLATLRAAPIWFVPLGRASRAALDERFATLTGGMAITPTRLGIAGRVWDVPQAAGVARLPFTDLCVAARGAGDYWALAHHFHTLMIDDIPQLGVAHRNEAARFVVLIDALYEHKVKMLASAAVPPAALYQIGDGAFEFARASSRLIEMQSVDYLRLAHITDIQTPA